MTIEEIESACDAGTSPDFSRNPFEVPEPLLQKMFYPLGFPAEVRTNSAEILTKFAEMWGVFEKRFDAGPIRVDVHVVESDSTECPPAPKTRHVSALAITIADADNYSVAHLTDGRTHVVLSRAALRHPLYPKHFFLNAAPLAHIVTQLATPIHSGCVALNGRGVLLCGDSGAGKSSLSYACARTGWTYVSDDFSLLPHNETLRMMTGNCHQVRLRPTAATLFPEIEGLEMTPRAGGKPSIEIPTASMPNIIRAQNTEIDFIVFLNRRIGGAPALVPYSKDVARCFMRQPLYGLQESRALQYQGIERLLTAEVLELRYTDLDWAVERLKTLVRDGV